jgi:hypothetical protein
LQASDQAEEDCQVSTEPNNCVCFSFFHYPSVSVAVILTASYLSAFSQHLDIIINGERVFDL